jgi:hypothetical protein
MVVLFLLLHITFCLLICALNPSGDEIFGLDIGLASLGSRALSDLSMRLIRLITVTVHSEQSLA